MKEEIINKRKSFVRILKMNSEINSLTDPKYIGPGVWYNIHLNAYESTDDKGIEDFIDYMYLLALKFPCKNCRKHINKYIEDHPFEDLQNMTNDEGRRIGMFKWAWLFHNAVNTRIHKPNVDWKTAWSMYDQEIEVCSKNCDEVEEVSGNKKEGNRAEPDHQHYIEDLPTDPTDRKSKLVQSYFMKIGIPNTLHDNGIYEDSIDDMVSFRSVGH